MFRKIINKPIILIIIPILIFKTTLHCETDIDKINKRIEGIVDFLIERANENIIYIFEKKIKSNPYIKEYFPNTTKMLSTFNLKILMLNGTLWKYNVEKDLDSITELLKNKLKQKGLALLASEKYEKLKELQQSIKLEDQNLADKINKIFKKTEENLKAIKIDALADLESLEIAQMLVDDLIKGTTELVNEVKISTKTKEVIETLSSLKNELINIKEILGNIQCALNKKLSYTIRITHIFFAIENLKSFEKIFSQNSIAYKKFKNYALFFAQLSDAESPEAAKIVLKTFALPPSSFIRKRRNEMRVSISAYVGLTIGKEIKNSNKLNYSGLVAPIGLELSWGTKYGSSLSILANLFDLGAPLNSRLYNTDSPIKYDNLIAPGLFFIYGFPELPLSIGFGGCKVRGIRDSSSNTQRLLLFIALDMPLFQLY